MTTRILLDVADDEVAREVAARLGGRARRVHARTPHDAVEALARGAAVVVVGALSGTPEAAEGPAGSAPDAVLAAIVQPVRWWVRAARTTGAFVVVLGDDEVFAGLDDRDLPDEWATPRPVTTRGRAQRAAGAIVDRAGGAVVRGPVGGDPAGLAAVVAWAVAGRHAGRWHVDGDGLDGRVTTLAMADRPLEVEDA